MSRSSSQRQQTQRSDAFSLLPYAYHEAGHAVVGHVIGRLIALVSIKQATSYRGCCRFDAYAESTHHHDQWQKGQQNPELLTILYAGTVAVSLLCEQRGWDDEVLRSSSLQDEAEVEQLSCEMFEDDAQRAIALDACRKQASDLLTTHWEAVKALAVLPSDMVENSINLSKPISGRFIRPGQIRQAYPSPSEAPVELF